MAPKAGMRRGNSLRRSSAKTIDRRPPPCKVKCNRRPPKVGGCSYHVKPRASLETGHRHVTWFRTVYNARAIPRLAPYTPCSARYPGNRPSTVSLVKRRPQPPNPYYQCATQEFADSLSSGKITWSTWRSRSNFGPPPLHPKELASSASSSRFNPPSRTKTLC